jgi:hypothetical protein
MIKKYFIGLFSIFQIYVDNKFETAQMICLHIAGPKSDIKYLGCLDISYSVDLLKICIIYFTRKM